MNRLNAVGIVAEYNPLHNGHFFHIQQSIEKSGADYCIVIMSGHITQRGEPAIYDSSIRTHMALLAGADLVLEMPAPFSCSSAEDFASYGVALLGSLGVPYMAFGTEDDSADMVLLLANILSKENSYYTDTLTSSLKLGLSYPAAREVALISELKRMGYGDQICASAKSTLSSPNNILAIEYTKAILKCNSPIQPICVSRVGSGYNDTQLGQCFASASAIRKYMKSGNELSKLNDYIPEDIISIINESYPLYDDDFTGSIVMKLITDIYEGRSLSDYYDISEDLGKRIASTYAFSKSFEDLVLSIKSKQYTYTRISRALMHILLGITKEKMEMYKSARRAPYARILGFRQESAALLSILKETSSVPLISKLADASSILEDDLSALSLLLDEVHAADIYASIYYDKYHIELPNSYSRQIIII